MKNTSKLIGIIVILALIGIFIVACDNGSTDKGTAPMVIDFITLRDSDAVNQRWIPANSFAINEPISVAIRWSDSDGDMRKYMLKVKIDSNNYWEYTTDHFGNHTEYTLFWGMFPRSEAYASLMFEIQLEDEKGNRSSIKTAGPVTVR